MNSAMNEATAKGMNEATAKETNNKALTVYLNSKTAAMVALHGVQYHLVPVIAEFTSCTYDAVVRDAASDTLTACTLVWSGDIANNIRKARQVDMYRVDGDNVTHITDHGGVDYLVPVNADNEEYDVVLGEGDCIFVYCTIASTYSEALETAEFRGAERIYRRDTDGVEALHIHTWTDLD